MDEKTQALDTRETERLSNSLTLAKDVITRDYLYQLKDYPIRPLSESVEKLDISEYTRLFHFRKLVADKNESMLDKMVTVLNTAYTSGATVVTLIQGTADGTDYYMGIVCKDLGQKEKNVATQGAIFTNALKGNFSGLELEQLLDTDIRSVCDTIFKEDYITAISGIASIRNEKQDEIQKYVQGIEHLVDSLQGKEYGVLMIADPISGVELTQAKSGYEALHTQLSPFLSTVLSFNETDSLTMTQTHTDSFSETLSNSTSLTQNYSRTSGWSDSHTAGTSRNRNVAGVIGSAVGGLVGIGLTVMTGGAALPLVAAAAGGGGMIGSGLVGSTSESQSDATSHSGSDTESSGTTKTQQESSSQQKSDSDAQSEGLSHGRTLQFTSENKTVKNLLALIDKHIERLEKCEAYGAFDCATYVISSDPETNAIVANGYNALMRGDRSSLQSSYINTWRKDEAATPMLKEYLKHFSHPQFERNRAADIVVTPASLVNSCELAVNVAIPKKSINGLPVLEAASFGRNIISARSSEPGENAVYLGKIYHMGMLESTEVQLNSQSLSSHTFITGSTGSGKSNAVYHLLDKLAAQDVRFLVIEPAKGEYKNVFGGRKDVSVYGTNARKSPLLRLNPFSFPDDIHVLEHIDRLVEIFNACWPMYAAMPAVLKDAIEQAYQRKGWELSSSFCASSVFPNFSDVLEVLPDVVKQSNYSADTQSDYIGSLYTRIKSLTNGINGQIFCSANELSAKDLFDRNVIVDLSRVGSVETKALLMGVLTMQLQEHRMASGAMNERLHHVTVLEEAHNLLRRTSDIQSQESSNLQGKSVEMIANAIAEMRTYGEGFIIADQAPGLMDPSVIRNTNTKIILRLPDEADRKLVGKAASLNDEQIVELAKLPLGVAAVYQNDWMEPVLCQLDKFSGEKSYNYQPQSESAHLTKFFCKLFDVSDNLELSEEEIEQIQKWKDSLNNHYMRTIVDNCLENRPVSVEEQGFMAYNLFDGKAIAVFMEQTSDRQEAVDQMKMRISKMPEICQNTALANQISDVLLHTLIEELNPSKFRDRFIVFDRVGGVG